MATIASRSVAAGNGFPGLAIVSLIVLLVALGFAALLSLQPWATSSVGPQVSVAPDLGIALDDAVRVPLGRQLAVAPAHPATGSAPKLVANEAVASEGGPGKRLGIGDARAVASPQPASPPAASPGPASPGPLPAQSPPPPAAVPVAVPTPTPSSQPAAPPVRTPTGKAPSGPGTAGGPIVGSPDEGVEVQDGDEHAFAFSFYLQPTVYSAPGTENLLMRFIGEGSESPSFGLQLWDGGGGQQGLWASGDAMGGERFLAPLAEGVWHEAVVYFKASSAGDGFYLLMLDGQPIDARAWISLIEPESSYALIEVGLFREGERVVDPADIFFGPTRLDDTLEA